jgi:hypothetical protein
MEEGERKLHGVSREVTGQELQEFRSCRSSGVAGVQELQEFRSSGVS